MVSLSPKCEELCAFSVLLCLGWHSKCLVPWRENLWLWKMKMWKRILWARKKDRRLRGLPYTKSFKLDSQWFCIKVEVKGQRFRYLERPNLYCIHWQCSCCVWKKVAKWMESKSEWLPEWTRLQGLTWIVWSYVCSHSHQQRFSYNILVKVVGSSQRT